jgi:hypothetical protein
MCQTGYIGLDITGTLTCPLRSFMKGDVDDYILISSV